MTPENLVPTDAESETQSKTGFGLKILPRTKAILEFQKKLTTQIPHRSLKNSNWCSVKIPVKYSDFTCHIQLSATDVWCVIGPRNFEFKQTKVILSEN